MVNVVKLSTVIGLSFMIAGAVCGGVAEAPSAPDHNYQKLQKAILDGKSISMTINLAACHVRGTAKPGPKVRGSVRPEGYMIEANQTIAFATTHFTVRNDSTPVDEFYLSVSSHLGPSLHARASSMRRPTSSPTMSNTTAL
jgi:VirK protein